MIRMSEIPTWTPELILGLIGTGVFGTIAAYIAIKKFLKEKPKLKIEVLKCIYELTTAAPKRTRLSIEFNVDNTGDRGTQLKTLDVSFRYKGKLYEDKQPLEAVEDTFVDAHKSKQIRHYFFFPDLSIELPAPTIDCTFTLHHTHNKERFSTKAPYPVVALTKEWKKPEN